MHTITVRLSHLEDVEQIEALEAQVQPYRPEDQAEVEAMYQRAHIAEKKNDRWVPVPTSHVNLNQTEPGYLAFWVAMLAEDQRPERIVGMVGVGHVNYGLLPPSMSYVQELQQRRDFVELQHLRVAPDLRGYGIDTQLCQATINWAKENGYKMLLVNTTVPQRPARELYEKLVFRETARSFVGLYELVWMECPLN